MEYIIIKRTKFSGGFDDMLSIQKTAKTLEEALKYTTALKMLETDKKVEFNVEDIEISIPKKEDYEEEELTKNGVVKFFNHEKGYGFISKKDSNESFFVHINNVIDEIKDNDKVSFEVEMGPKGPIAVNVKVTG